MINFSAYDSLGRITCHANCQDEFADQLPDGAILGHHSANDYYVDVVTKSLVSKPAQPTMHHEFDYITKTWFLDMAKAWSLVRNKRDQLLTDCDWVVTKALESGSTVPQAWSDYRQALRNITTQPDPTNISWPTPP